MHREVRFLTLFPAIFIISLLASCMDTPLLAPVRSSAGSDEKPAVLYPARGGVLEELPVSEVAPLPVAESKGVGLDYEHPAQPPAFMPDGELAVHGQTPPSPSTRIGSSANRDHTVLRVKILHEVWPGSLESPLHNVVVHDIPVRDVLFALARDSALNMDVHPDIAGSVTLNVRGRPLRDILERIARQLPLRHEFHNDTLFVLPDTPYFRHYELNYLNLARSTLSNISLSTQISSIGAESGGGNSSSLSVDSEFKHDFWKGLHAGLASLLNLPLDATVSELALNPETGIIMVKATAEQHQKIESLLADLQNSLRRQVLIQAVVVEVALNDEYRAGIDWSRLALDSSGFSIAGRFLGGAELVPENARANTGSSLVLDYKNAQGGGRLQAAVELLSEFGETRVMSSPQIMVLNNHTAVLKVVENFVYFEIKQELNAENNATGANALLATSTSPQTIPIGLVMTVTPSISADERVLLSVRPTISSVVRTEKDPNPSLGGVENRVPVVRVRELESVLQMQSNQVAVLGGLMQDNLSEVARGVPYVSDVPWLGSLFRSQVTVSSKTELVIFMRPVIMGQAV
ncbi:MAG: pilus (MSHA type) biogenesis protein MshL [Candidatus Eutrophobiaceae bacterium]